MQRSDNGNHQDSDPETMGPAVALKPNPLIHYPKLTTLNCFCISNQFIPIINYFISYAWPFGDTCRPGQNNGPWKKGYGVPHLSCFPLDKPEG
jgi:hypothetical protein